MKRPQPWRTLRGRLAGAMAVVFVLAVAASALVDRMQAPPPASPAGARPGALESEPYQDGLVLAAFTLPALLAIWLVSSWSLRPLLRASAEAQGVGPAATGRADFAHGAAGGSNAAGGCGERRIGPDGAGVRGGAAVHGERGA